VVKSFVKKIPAKTLQYKTKTHKTVKNTQGQVQFWTTRKYRNPLFLCDARFTL